MISSVLLVVLLGLTGSQAQWPSPPAQPAQGQTSPKAATNTAPVCLRVSLRRQRVLKLLKRSSHRK